MVETRLQGALLLILVLVIGVSCIKGHSVSFESNAVAFLPDARSDKNKSLIRIMGDVASAGVYEYTPTIDVGTVINMTVGVHVECCDTFVESLRHAPAGMTVTVRTKSGKCIDIAKENLKTREKIALGIPLDENLLGTADWEALPGIGKITAERIVLHRQINGGFSSLNDLYGVPGIGPATVRKIKPYFE